MSQSHLVPRFDTLVVERDPEKKQTDGGIILPDQVVQPPWIGTVVAASAKWEDDFPLGVRVLFRAYVGTEYADGDKKWLLINATDVLATLQPSSAGA